MESGLIPKGKTNTFLKIFYLLRGIPGRIEKINSKLENGQRIWIILQLFIFKIYLNK